jgi:hypothetical protein
MERNFPIPMHIGKHHCLGEYLVQGGDIVTLMLKNVVDVDVDVDVVMQEGVQEEEAEAVEHPYEDQIIPTLWNPTVELSILLG